MSLSSRRAINSSKRPKVIKPKPEPIRQRAPRPRPNIELGLTVDLTFHFSAKHPTREDDIVVKGSKSFQEMPPKEHIRLFQHKVKECMKLCDFSNPNKDQKAKVTKTKLLQHIDSCFTNPDMVKTITPECIKDLVEMVSVNIFRQLPIMPIRGPLDANDSVIDDGWPHISLAYECLIDSFMSPHTGNFVTQSFIYKLIGNGISLDDNERLKVGECLKAIYVRYMNLRAGMRKSLGNHFKMQRCSNELLIFYNSAIDGFNAPLKPEHLKFFKESLLPLHTNEKFPKIYERYIECLSKMIEKQSNLLDDTFKYMKLHWPQSERPKQISFLNEVEYLILTHQKHINSENVKTAFQIIGNSIFNDNADVVDKALDILTNSKIIDVILKYSTVIFPLVIENLLRVAKNHWDKTISGNAMVALQGLNEIDAEAFRKVNDVRVAKMKAKNTTLSQWNSKWMKILDSAKISDPGIKNFDFSALPKSQTISA
ncbi:phosphoprotein phosphatase [Tritrichomonas foetus]|uniref:Phosphoprotein phosphatase n=1 Tax=Tritrichomonas foetus TaxID=1144522 RepID=A0A1J4KVD6_9EUKA|nr:phosphoprotein phosphatase [Tritrichomonas foetus]|eukprot:OHT13692.1 phosphoprotein phosphatase [Tritrichomonas foetus]